MKLCSATDMGLSPPKRMEGNNTYQIKYIIRFLLLWIIFQVTAAAEDFCSYQASSNSIMNSNYTDDAIITVLNEFTSTDECGQKCCNVTDCSAALFNVKTCVLVNCELIPGGCIPSKIGAAISLIRTTRASEGQRGNNSIHEEESEVGDPVAANQSSDINVVTPSNEAESITVPVTEEANGDSDGSNFTETTVAPKIEPTAKLSDLLSSSTTSKYNGGVTPSSDVSSKSSTSPTPETQKTTPTGQLKLSVTTGHNQKIRLPEDSVTIHAGVTPKQNKSLDYRWKLIEHPDDFEGTQSGIDTETLKLATLTQGEYQFKVEVHGENSYGEAFVNVTVLPKLRVNKPPVAIISPPFQELVLPTDNTLLDGSKSHDDDGIELYEWEEMDGPLQANINKDEHGNFPNEKVLKITGLVVGNYTFKLTVTDTDKATDSALATIIVKDKIDNPPIANAGSNQVIHMPQNSAVLCGNDSTDDWGIVQYKWSLSPDSKRGVVDMQGAREKCVKVSTLEVGDYIFQLTVTDEAGQEDTAKVTIIVQPESNHPPLANAGKDQQLLLPLDDGAVTANLDGSESTDDKAITSVLWKMASGPESVTIVKSNSLKTSVTGITKPGKYVMTLTVTDADGDSSSDDVVITVKEEQPPVAKAGPDIVIVLPDNVAMLDGSKSSDDYGISAYQWTRTDRSPAAGFALNSSDHQSILHVAELVEGTYSFVLKVTNIRGKSSEDDAVVTVLSDPLTSNLVELHLDADISRFDQEHKLTVIKQLEVLLSLQADDKIIVRNIFAEHGTGHLVVLFYVKLKAGEIMHSQTVTDSLNSKLKHDVEFLEFKFLRADTYVCDNTCSGHGRCRSGSHECECELFWMENFFRVYMGDGKRNCEWSVLYVGIVIFLLITSISCAVWFITCYCLGKREKKPSTRRRKNHATHDKARYEKLPTKSHRNGHARKNGYVRPSAAYKTSSIMRSVSSSTTSLSDSDTAKDSTLFERKRLLVNGGGKFNGAFDLDSNPTKSSLRKNSSFSRTVNTSSPLHNTDRAFGHQSTLLKVGNSSEEENIL